MAPRDLIGLLSQPFAGGGGPSHSTVGLIWESAGAGDYLPDEGNKLDRVRYGLRHLRDGFKGPEGYRPARSDLFQAVVEDLGSRLSAADLIDADELDARLRELDDRKGPGVASPARSTPRAPSSEFSDVFAQIFTGQQSARRHGPLPQEARQVKRQTVFIIHGHDPMGYRHRIANLVNEFTGAQATILHDRPNAGRTILEKFEEHAATARFAIALFTGDDMGGPKDGDSRSRARQNVIFELGFFFGRLGRERTAVLIEPSVERPSDIDGLVYIGLDAHEGWRFNLLRELSAAKIEVRFPER